MHAAPRFASPLAPSGSWRRRLSQLARSPAAWIIAGLAVLRLTGIGWGLPASDAWDNDGVAPRDFLPGLIETFTPGRFYTYPPLHLAILALLASPIAAAAVVRAPSLQPQALVQTFIRVPTMTSLAYVARFTTVAMSLGVTFALGRLAREIWGERAGRIALLTTGLSVPFTYYAHTSCLDVPYLFWAALAMLEMVRAMTRGEPRRLRRAMVLAALAIATKDQAYGLFLLSVPAAVAAWSVVDRKRPILRETAIGAALSAATLVLADGIAVNPTGFRARMAFLLGSASQDYAQYTNDWRGRSAAIVDLVKSFGAHYPWVLLPLVVAGLALHVRTTRGVARLAGLVPIAAAVSFSLSFNLSARRVEDRFAMPQMILAAMYAAPVLDRIVFAGGPAWSRRLRAGGAAVLLALGVFECLEADAMLLFDPRYDAEAFLRDRVASGDAIETFGLNVYLPRFPRNARVERIGPEPLAKRSPLPNVTERLGDYASATGRGARWIVVSRAWAWKYLPSEGDRPPGEGRVVPPALAAAMADAGAATFFRSLFRGERGYRLAHESRYAARLLRRVDINASLGCTVDVFERSAP